MKALKDLGISQFPWKRESTSVNDANGECVANCCTWNANAIRDAHMMEAAPDLYEFLREAVEDKCETCKNSWYGNCVTKDGSPCSQVKKWREALAKASGEEVAK